jgi:hypothetical protein
MAHFSHQRNRLQPAKAFFDPLPLLLADDVSHVPRGAAINRAPTVPSQVLRHMRHHSQVPALGQKPARVKPYIATHRH